MHKIFSRNSTLNIRIRIYLRSFIYHHHLFTTEKLHLTTASSVKSISRVTLSENAIGRGTVYIIRLSYFF